MKLGKERPAKTAPGFRPKETKSAPDFPHISRVRNEAGSSNAGMMGRVTKMLVGVAVVMLIGLWAAAAAMSPRRHRGAESWAQNGHMEGGRPLTAREAVRESAGADRLRDVEQDGEATLQWAREKGTSVGPLRFSLFQHGQQPVRGLGYSSASPANATLISVPRKLILTGLDVTWDRTYGAGWLAGPKGGKAPESDMLLAVRLSEEFAKGTSSLWAFYLQQLPKSEDYEKFHPLMANRHDLELYKDLPTVKSVENRRRWVRERFKALGLDGHFDFVDFWYAYVTYISRAYGITVGKTWVPAVVPLADYGNTALRQNINARWAYDEDAQAFKVM
eukprot:CAMPEP_0180201178 /NCGR_PEP_ID=MMETSP0987-20121128/6611_1 /TAXON_ID=697907 /ORGANISM="non described non described, Strain CCMP2293" /LENGTH=332 /DNA_ID=CAMNT_0022156327 /DNA_START=45 /DNA_END=1040 /DNA_ORIENTATION=+